MKDSSDSGGENPDPFASDAEAFSVASEARRPSEPAIADSDLKPPWAERMEPAPSLDDAVKDAIERADLPADILDRTKELPGTPYEHADSFKSLSDADRLNLRRAFQKQGFPVADFDKLTGRAGDAGDGKQPSHSDRLVAIVESSGCVLFHDGESVYADIECDGHRETWPVRSRGFALWLQHRYFENHGGAPGKDALESARGVIEARGRFHGSEGAVCRRVAMSDDEHIYLDLCNPAWQAVEIDAGGWRIVDRPPARFVRAKTAREIPAPVTGGTIAELRPFLNVQNDRDFVLAVGWALMTFRVAGPFPVLALTGEHGSAKSTFARLLRTIMDPQKIPLRVPPRNEQDLFVGARGAHILAFDNMSGIPAWLSDGLCRIATGGGFAARELYSDDEEAVINVVRPQILNGIDEVVSRGDLADRCIFLNLSPIPKGSRKTESELLAEFESARPRILGAMLSMVSTGLRRHSAVRLGGWPRMADFARWATACEHGAFRDGAFEEAYTGNRADAMETVIEGSPVAGAIRELMKERIIPWEGTSANLHGALEDIADDRVVKSKSWPANPQVLSRNINRHGSVLRQVGLVIERKREGSRRTIRIAHLAGTGEVGEFASFASRSVTDDANDGSDAISQDSAVPRGGASLPYARTQHETARDGRRAQSPGTRTAGAVYQRMKDGE